MARPGRRVRLRRYDAERFRPIPDAALWSGPPREKRLVQSILAAVFVAGMVAILNVFPSGPRLREGRVARHDVRARVNFQVPDIEATRREREERAARALRVFQEDADPLARVSSDLENFLQRVSDASNPTPLTTVARQRWGLTRDRVETLQKSLQRDWIGPTVEHVQSAIAELERDGIMDGAVHQGEFDAERYEIEVRRAGAPPERRPLIQVKAYPSGLREFFRTRLLLRLHDKPAAFREILLDMLVHAAKPTLQWDEAETAKARTALADEVKPRFRTVVKGSLIVSAGYPVTARALEEIACEARAFQALPPTVRAELGESALSRAALLRAVGRTGAFLLGFALLALYAMRFAPDVVKSNTRVFAIFAACLFTLGSLRLLETLGLSLHWTPLILAAMVLTPAAGPAITFGAASLVAALAGIATEGGVYLALPLLAGAAAATLRLTRLRRRTDPFEAGLAAGGVAGIMVAALHACRMAGGEAAVNGSLLESLAASVGGGALSGIVLTASLPYVERLFDVATDLRLLEWTDHNQPLLRQLAIEAPGTYHHSTVVGNMAEAAAKMVGANPLLARAGGYLHDVGKLQRPEYFIENMPPGTSLHDTLTPALSTLILTAHPKDGAEIARSFGVPNPLRRIIAEHHGTGLVQFFYQKACDQAERSGEEVKEAMFRYRGPRPRSPEAAIVMLADAVESASRTLQDASPSRVEGLVHGIVQSRLEDGQLDDCRMRITEIRRVEAGLVRSLLGMTHRRIRYPAL